MAQVCNGLCIRFKTRSYSSSTRYRYKLGQKFCSNCALFFYTEKFICPCCKTKLRSKSRGKKHDL